MSELETIHFALSEVSSPEPIAAYESSKAKTKKTAPDQFVRIEDKFIVPSAREKALTELIAAHLAPSYVTENTQFTLIESVYFDSVNLDFFRDHFSKPPTRHKLRLRRYAPNGVWSKGEVFLEAKTKSKGVSSKERMSIDKKSLGGIMAGGPIVIGEDLYSANERMPRQKVNERAERINSIISIYNLEPRISIQYKRFAYERDGMRMTLDREIIYKNHSDFNREAAQEVQLMPYWPKAQSYGKKFSNQRSIILEVKHLQGRPQWLEEFMNQLGLSCTSFSKYCWGITNLVEGKLNA